MRVNTILLMLTLALVPLSGCLGFGDEDEDSHGDECDHLEGADHDDCHDDPGHGGGNGNQTNGGNGNNTSAPNVLPNGMLTMTAEDGTVLDASTAILPGQTIQFSAQGSEDPDGSIDLIGLTVKDTNSTRTVQLLVDGEFQDAILKFDAVGVINITMRVLDDRGEGVVVMQEAYVNAVDEGTAEVTLYDPLAGGCTPSLHTDQASVIGQQFYHKKNFVVPANAAWFSVTATGTDAVSICDPEGNEIGEGDGSTAQGEWPTATDYYVALHPSGPNQEVAWTITVHFEDKPAA